MATAKRKSEDQLLAVQPTGEYRMVPCTYEGIKDGVNGSPFDFVQNEHIGMYVDDEGMLNGLHFNVPASIFMARALWGPVVLCSSRADDDGNTVPATNEAVNGFKAIARLWQQVLADSLRLGQDVMTRANESTLPPPQVFEFRTDEEFDAFLRMGTLPKRKP